MFKTLRSKLLFGTIISVIIINIIFTIFIALFLENTLRTDIINEITNIKKFSIKTINENELIGESKWKSLNSIKGLTNSYVSMINDKGETNEYISVAISEDEINNIVNESKNFKSIIRFKRLNNIYCVTYNYPIYLDNDFYCNLIIQKDYSEKYNKNINVITIVVMGQVIVVLSIIAVISIIISKVTKPINELNKSMKDLSKSINSKDIIINSNDEVGELSKSYNLMKNKIKDQMEIIIEEKEKVEELQKVSREFFNNATHELKTPVTAISLYAQIFKENKLNELDEEFINRASDRIIMESEKMKILVEKILDISRGKINSSKNKCEFSLTKLIEEIIEDFQVRIESNGYIINKRLQEVTIYSVLEDIELIIINLIDNAVKYNVGKRIDINLYKEEGNIVFSIINKCGNFPKDIKDKLLEPFIKYNSYKDISKEISSSGLGLYLCKELAYENYGELFYEINEGKINFILKFDLDKG
ncbi:MAG: HAMP domain-containing sensor histidine kinase [Clostridium sp.]|nr:HAMP domain-containing sensor histidine kinase [Clostridium sp.]